MLRKRKARISIQAMFRHTLEVCGKTQQPLSHYQSSTYNESSGIVAVSFYIYQNKQRVEFILLSEEELFVEAGESKQLDPALLTIWHRDYSSRVRAFLIGLLRNSTLVDEALQATFTKALTEGGVVRSGSERAWLFQVAYNEAMAIRRRATIHNRAIQKIQDEKRTSDAGKDGSDQPLVNLLQKETIHRVQSVIEQLSERQREVVQKRIYDGKTFQQIADELNIPIGTALTRMRAALVALQNALKHDSDTR